MPNKVNVTAALLTKMCKIKPNASNLNSVVTALNTFGDSLGLLEAQNLAHYLSQVMHESGSFKYDREIWGPTPAQKRYEGRKDLGNTQKGDGHKFAGRTAIQLTGRANYTKFYKWAKALCIKLGLPAPPDFVKNPELVNTDPWEGLAPIWFWSEGNSTGKSLNRYAKDNNILMITRIINGGLNGFDDRLSYYGRIALVLLGYGTSKQDIIKFQTKMGKAKVGDADGVIGDKTRMALHDELGGKNPFKVVEAVTAEVPVAVDKPVAVKVEELEKPWYKSMDGIQQVATGPVGITAVGWLTDIPWEKIAVLSAVALISFGIWYFIRQKNKKEQDAKVKEIKIDAEVAKDEIRQQATTARLELKEAKANAMDS